MKPTKPESWRERYIRLLSGPSNVTDSQDDLQAMRELIESKYLQAQFKTDMHGTVNCVAGKLLPTPEGRIFSEEQQAIIRSRTFFGRLNTSWPMFSGLVGVIVGWILTSWHPFGQQRQYIIIQQQDGTPSSTNLANQKPGQTPAPVQPPTPAKAIP